MKKLLVILPLFLLPLVANASDNVAACEAVMVEEVKEDGEPTGAVIQTFAPASDILASIYDDEEGFEDEIDGRKVKAILCQRSTVIPTLRDFPILKTGLPFALSTDFEAADSRSVTIFYKDGEFQHIFKGAELSEDQEADLANAMEVFNFQPHDLPKSKATKKRVAETDTPEKKDTNEESSDGEEVEESTDSDIVEQDTEIAQFDEAEKTLQNVERKTLDHKTEDTRTEISDSAEE